MSTADEVRSMEIEDLETTSGNSASVNACYEDTVTHPVIMCWEDIDTHMLLNREDVSRLHGSIKGNFDAIQLKLFEPVKAVRQVPSIFSDIIPQAEDQSRLIEDFTYHRQSIVTTHTLSLPSVTALKNRVAILVNIFSNISLKYHKFRMHQNVKPLRSKKLESSAQNINDEQDGTSALIEIGVKTGLSLIFSLLRQSWNQRNEGLIILSQDILETASNVMLSLPPLSLSNDSKLGKLAKDSIELLTDFLRQTVAESVETNDKAKSLASEIFLCLALQRGSLLSILEWVDTMLKTAVVRNGNISTAKFKSLLHRMREQENRNKIIVEDLSNQDSENGCISFSESSLILVGETAKLAQSYIDSTCEEGSQKQKSQVSGKAANQSFVWGSNSSQQLSEGSQDKILAPKLSKAFSPSVKIEAGQYCTFAIMEDGSLYGCGKGSYCRLGLGDSGSQPQLKKIKFKDCVSICQVSSSKGSDGHTLALTLDGQVYSWGDGDHGKLGHGNSLIQKVPKLIQGPFRGKVIRHVSAGNRHSAAVTEDGELYTWGEGDFGRLGHGDSSSKTVPVKVKNIGLVGQVACGSAYTLALSQDGMTVWSFGSGDSGKLGHGENNKCFYPKVIQNLDAIGIRKVVAGCQCSIAVAANGLLYSWGCGPCLGSGAADSVFLTPKVIEALENNFVVDISMGDNHCLALTREHEVYAWGNNSMGQCGLRHSITPVVTPQKLPCLADAKIHQISAGSTHSIALTAPPTDRHIVASYRPYCIALKPETFGKLRKFMEYCLDGSNGCSRFNEDFMLHTLHLLGCHLQLLLKDSSYTDLIGHEAQPIKELLFNMLDFPLSEEVKTVTTEILQLASQVLLPDVSERARSLTKLLPDSWASINKMSSGQKLHLEILLSSLADHHHTAELLSFCLRGKSEVTADFAKQQGLEGTDKARLLEILLFRLTKTLNLFVKSEFSRVTVAAPEVADDELPAVDTESYALLHKKTSSLLTYIQKHLLAILLQENTEISNMRLNCEKVMLSHLPAFFAHTKGILKDASEILQARGEVDAKHVTEKLGDAILQSPAGSALAMVLFSLPLVGCELVLPLLEEMFSLLQTIDDLNQRIPGLVDREEAEIISTGKGLNMGIASAPWMWLSDLERALAFVIGRTVNGLLLGKPLSAEEKDQAAILSSKLFEDGLEEQYEAKGILKELTQNLLHDCSPDGVNFNAILAAECFAALPASLQYYLNLAFNPTLPATEDLWRHTYDYGVEKEIIIGSDDKSPLVIATTRHVLAALLKHCGWPAIVERIGRHAEIDHILYDGALSVYRRLQNLSITVKSPAAGPKDTKESKMEIDDKQRALVQACKSVIHRCLLLLFDVCSSADFESEKFSLFEVKQTVSAKMDLTLSYLLDGLTVGYPLESGRGRLTSIHRTVSPTLTQLALTHQYYRGQGQLHAFELALGFFTDPSGMTKGTTVRINNLVPSVQLQLCGILPHEHNQGVVFSMKREVRNKTISLSNQLHKEIFHQLKNEIKVDFPSAFLAYNMAVKTVLISPSLSTDSLKDAVSSGFLEELLKHSLHKDQDVPDILDHGKILQSIASLLFRQIALQISFNAATLPHELLQSVVSLVGRQHCMVTPQRFFSSLMFFKQLCLANAKMARLMCTEEILFKLLEIAACCDHFLSSRILAIRIMTIILEDAGGKDLRPLVLKVTSSLIDLLSDLTLSVQETGSIPLVCESNEGKGASQSAICLDVEFDLRKLKTCAAENGTTLIHCASDRGIGVINYPIRYGCYEWTFYVETEVIGNEGSCVGVCKWPINDMNYTNSSDTWLYRAYNGSLYHGGESTKLLSPFTQGDLIKCKLDMNERRLSFSKNELEFTVAFDDIDAPELYPCVVFCGIDRNPVEKIKVMDFKQVNSCEKVYVGSPRCAPVSITMIEEVVTCLRKLHSKPALQDVVDEKILATCESLNKAREGATFKSGIEAYKLAISLVLLIGGADHGLRIAGECKAEDKEAIVLGCTNNNGKVVLLHSDTDQFPVATSETLDVKPLESKVDISFAAKSTFAAVLRQIVNSYCTSIKELEVAMIPTLKRNSDHDTPVTDSELQRIVRLMYLCFTTLKAVLRLIQSPIFGKMLVYQYHKTKKLSSSTSVVSVSEEEDQQKDGPEEEVVNSLQEMMNVLSETAASDSPFKRPVFLQEIDRAFSVLITKTNGFRNSDHDTYSRNQLGINTDHTARTEEEATGVKSKPKDGSNTQLPPADATFASPAHQTMTESSSASTPTCSGSSSLERQSTISDYFVERETLVRSLSVDMGNVNGFPDLGEISSSIEEYVAFPDSMFQSPLPTFNPVPGPSHSTYRGESRGRGLRRRHVNRPRWQQRTRDVSPRSSRQGISDVIQDRDDDNRQSSLRLNSRNPFLPEGSLRNDRGSRRTLSPRPARSQQFMTALDQAIESISEISEPLIEMGFTPRHIHRALNAINVHEMSESGRINALLQWLLQNPLSDDETNDGQSLTDGVMLDVDFEDVIQGSVPTSLSRSYVVADELMEMDDFLSDNSVLNTDPLNIDASSSLGSSSVLLQLIFGGDQANNTTHCEICDADVSSFNAHMSSDHPGCGRNMSQHGYRSNGSYVDGWFGGLCGSGSPYYLLCTDCRGTYLARAREVKLLSSLPESHPFDAHMVADAPDLLAASDPTPALDTTPAVCVKEQEDIFMVGLEDLDNQEGDAMISIGLSDCRSLPPVVEFPTADPLGQAAAKRTSSVLSLLQEYGMEGTSNGNNSVKTLAEQFLLLRSVGAILYGADKLCKSATVTLSRAIAFTLLSNICLILDVPEKVRGLRELGQLSEISDLISLLRAVIQDIFNGSLTQSVLSQENGNAHTEVLGNAIQALLLTANGNALEYTTETATKTLVNIAKGERKLKRKDSSVLPKDAQWKSRGKHSAERKLANVPDSFDQEQVTAQFLVELVCHAGVLEQAIQNNATSSLMKIMDCLSSVCLSCHVDGTLRQWAMLQLVKMLSFWMKNTPQDTTQDLRDMSGIPKCPTTKLEVSHGEVVRCEWREKRNLLVCSGTDDTVFVWRYGPRGRNVVQHELTFSRIPEYSEGHRRWTVHDGRVNNLCLNSNGSLLAGSQGSMISVWVMPGGRSHVELEYHHVTCLVWPAQQGQSSVLYKPKDSLLIGRIDGSVGILEVKDCSSFDSVELEHCKRNVPVSSMAWFASGKNFIVAYMDGVMIESSKDDESITTFKAHEGSITMLSYDAYGHFLASLPEGDTVKVWRCKNGHVESSWSMPFTCSCKPTYIAWRTTEGLESRAVAELAIGCTDGEVHILSVPRPPAEEVIVASDTVEQEVENPESDSQAHGAVASISHHEEITMEIIPEDYNSKCDKSMPSNTKSIQGQRMSSGATQFAAGVEECYLSGLFHGHTGIIICLAYSQTSHILASGCSNGVVNIWDTDSSLLFQTYSFPGPVTSLTWISETGFAVTYSGCKEVTIIKIPEESYQELLPLAHCRQILVRYNFTGLGHCPFLRVLLQKLMDIIGQQYAYEVNHVKNFSQLIHSSFLQSLLVLAWFFDLDNVPQSDDDRAWLHDYFSVVRNASTLTKRGREGVHNAVASSDEIAASTSLDWTLHMDEQLMTWSTANPSDWESDMCSNVLMWGSGAHGQLAGLGVSLDQPTHNTAVRQVRDIVCGQGCTFVVHMDGTVASCGEGTYGRLGHGNSDDIQVLTPINALSGYTVVQLATSLGSEGHCLALTDAGEVFSWGDGDYGKLGHDSLEKQRQPKQIMALRGKHVIQVACGHKHSAVVTLDGELLTFGSGEHGKLGHGTNTNKRVPCKVTAFENEEVSQVACGLIHTLAVTNRGKHLWAFGGGIHGQLGIGLFNAKTSPVKVTLPTEGEIKKIACGGQFSLALMQDGNVYGFGQSRFLGTHLLLSENSSMPNVITTLAEHSIVDISVGFDYVLALDSTSSVWSWGNNRDGQLGIGHNEAQATPQQVQGLRGKNVNRISAGRGHCAAWRLPEVTDSTSRKQKMGPYFGLPTKIPSQYTALQGIEPIALRDRLVYLHNFSDLVLKTWKLMDLGRSVELLHPSIEVFGGFWDGSIRNVLTNKISSVPLARALTRTMLQGRSAGPHLTVERLALREEKPESILKQVARQVLKCKPSDLCLPSRAWKVRLVGEAADDAGGVYDDIITDICQELEMGESNLLIPTPNSLVDVGYNRDRYLLNPNAKSKNDLDLYKFLGILMGVALRTKKPLDLHLAPPVWKQLVSIPLTVNDLGEVDTLFVQNVRGIRHIEKSGVDEHSFSDAIPLESFEGQGSDGRFVPVMPGGHSIPLTFGNRDEYVDRAIQYRLQETKTQVNSVREGLGSLLPLPVLNLMTPSRLEELVCGAPFIDIDLLRRLTRYREVSEDAPLIKWFWDTLSTFTPQEKVLFLRFVSGRSRLPANPADIPQRLQIIGGSKPKDGLPTAQTCFFVLRLPPYSSREKLADRLRYAINNCRAIDCDRYMLERNEEDE